MHKLYFDNIFYSSENIKSLVEGEKAENDYDVFLLPHKYLDSNLGAMYKDVFSHIKDGRPIVFVSELHNYNIGKSKFYTTEVISKALDGIEIDNALLEEEFSLELVYQVAKETNSNSDLFSLFTSLKDKDSINELSSLIKKIKKDKPDAAFIISGNFTSFELPSIAGKQAKTLLELLKDKSPLKHPGNKKEISGSAYKIIEAFRSAFDKQFILSMSLNNDKLSYNCLEDNGGEIYHVSGVFI